MTTEWHSHIQRHGKYRSGYEKQIGLWLRLKGISAWHEHMTLHYRTNYQDRVYKPDFVAYRKDGTVMVIEAKGYLDRYAADKMIRVSYGHPNLDIRMVAQRDSKVGGTGLKMSEWCEWKGFPLIIGEELDAWLPELMTREEFKASGLPVPPKSQPSCWELFDQQIAQGALSHGTPAAA